MAPGAEPDPQPSKPTTTHSLPPRRPRPLALGKVDPKYVGQFNAATIKATVGLLAIALPIVEALLTKGWIRSISASFWFTVPSPLDSHAQNYEICQKLGTGAPWFDLGTWPRTYLVGTLLGIGALLLSYRGDTRMQGWLARIAAVGAAGVALFPCKCDCYTEIVRGLHYFSAAIVYGVLIYFVIHFYCKASDKILAPPPAHDERVAANAKRRRRLYALCVVGMALSVLTIAISSKLPDAIRPVLIGEGGGLVFFGLAWLVASRVTWIFTTENVDRQPFL